MTEKLPHEYTNDDYTLMQKTFYERETDIMSIENHGLHNDNPDYWNILLKPLTSGDWSDKLVLDFGCGCGRNVQNILNRFVVKEAHGCDISSNNVHHCEKITPTLTGGKTNFRFVTVDGQSLQPLPSNTYSLIISTIVLQHICVYSIRKSILADMARCLVSGGMISLQMGYGMGHPNGFDYYHNANNVQGTNSLFDTRVTDPNQIKNDLLELGFVDFDYVISHPWSDTHENWIYFTAKKA
jgi:ubiquinone/menaquinone biosynthesis C-methylase UbiE